MLKTETHHPAQGTGGCGSLALATPLLWETAALLNEVQALSWHTHLQASPSRPCPLPLPPQLPLVLFPGPGRHQAASHLVNGPCCSLPGALLPLDIVLSAQIVLSQKPSPTLLSLRLLTDPDSLFSLHLPPNSNSLFPRAPSGQGLCLQRFSTPHVAIGPGAR